MNSQLGKIIWANTIDDKLPLEYLAFFPTGSELDNKLDKIDISFLQEELSPLYQAVISVVTTYCSKFYNLEAPALEVILREPLVLITYTFMDRLLRYKKLLSNKDYGIADLNVANAGPPIWPRTESQLVELLNNSQKFQQYLLMEIGKIWKIKSFSENRLSSLDVRNFPLSRNNTFKAPNVYSRIKQKIGKLFSSYTGSFAALPLANIEAHLLDKGLYGTGKLAWLSSKAVNLKDLHNQFRNEELRTLLVHEIDRGVADIYSTLMSKCDVNDIIPIKESLKCLGVLASELIPVERLEGSYGYQECSSRLRQKPLRALLFCGMPGRFDIFWIAAAKTIKLPIVGIQHGAHYGFIEHSNYVELEYAYCDSFITWGWHQRLKHRLSKKIEIISLPSPSISERTKKWASITSLKSGQRHMRPFDVLLMTDRLQMFPPTLSTLRMSRCDFISQIEDFMTGVISGLAQREIRVLHKPYNNVALKIQSGVLASFAQLYPKHYFIQNQLDKGLTESMLKQAWIVVWDEPGTGFFECLAAGIPTMLYWDRLIGRESPNAEEVFLNLESVGLLHNNVNSTVNAISAFLNSPERWLEDLSRKKVIDDALELYAKKDLKWSETWKMTLKKWQ